MKVLVKVADGVGVFVDVMVLVGLKVLVNV